jgi:Rad3-related DNA helicase
MTLPDERYRAVLAAKELLIDLTDPTATPRIPQMIRLRAGHCLRHFPSDWEMQQVAEASPHVFAERMEDVTRLFKKYEESKAEKNEN